MSASQSAPLLPGTGTDQVFAPGPTRMALESSVLPQYVAESRWFGGKARAPQTFRLADIVPIGETARLGIVEVTYADRTTESYLLPMRVAAKTDEALPGVIAQFEDGAVLQDAIHDDGFRSALFRLMAEGGSCAGEDGELTGVAGAPLTEFSTPPNSRALSVEQSNSSIVYGDRIFLKLYRRLEEGANPDAEILSFLGEQNFSHVPPFGGAIEYRSAKGGKRVLALALGMVPNDGDAWSYTLRHLARYYGLVHTGDSREAERVLTEYLEAAAQLGTRTGELHLALASDTDAADFTPEPFTTLDANAVVTASRAAGEQVAKLLEQRHEALDEGTRDLARQFRAAEQKLLQDAQTIAESRVAVTKTRTHGDYHLGQVLHGPNGFIIIDFEGEPLRSLPERRRKMSPYRDIAGMLRSFHYAAHAALEPLGEARGALSETAERWAQQAQQTFLQAWMAATQHASFRVQDPGTERALLNVFLLEKALYEIRYEVNNRPTWLSIPLRGVLALKAG